MLYTVTQENIHGYADYIHRKDVYIVLLYNILITILDV